MMSQATIRELSRQAAMTAARQHKIPFVVEREDIEDAKAALAAGRMPAWKIPQLGDYVPAGWERVRGDDGDPVEYFVDSSGFGGEDEPALTFEAFVRALEPGYGYAVTDVGQFQVYVGKYRRLLKSAADTADPYGARFLVPPDKRR